MKINFLKMKRYTYILYLITCTHFINAQSNVKDLPQFAFTSNVGIPNVTASSMYRNSFSGIVSAEAAVTCKLASKYFIGVGYNYSYLRNQDYWKDQVGINTSLQVQGGFIKLGLNHFINETTFVTVGVNTGYAYGKYQGVAYQNDTLKGKNPTTFNNVFIEPIIGVYFVVDPNFAIGGHISYNYNFEQFNPKYPNFENRGFSKTESKPAYRNLNNNSGMSMLTIGFGFYFGLTRK